MDPKCDTFFTNIPKIELHAHLNGSLSAETLEHLGCSQENILEYQKLVHDLEYDRNNLEKCFSLFKIAHNATNNVQSVYKATKHVIQEFSSENVVYLELRTTPRKEINMSKESYIDAVIQGIKDSNRNIITKLILSIDRAHDLASSQESLKLIIEMKKKYPDIVKGVDLCGNPSLGLFDEKLFKLARENDLFITLHCGEVANYEEIQRIINFSPDRIGHGTFLHPNKGNTKECWDIYCKKAIPLECCLTSNILCGTVANYEDHHIQHWIKNSLPFCLCTDDKGVFATNASRELKLAFEHYNLNNLQVWKMIFNSINFSFASSAEKEYLRGLLEEWRIKNDL